MSVHEARIIESIECLRDLFPPRELFNRLVEEGAYGDELHCIDGDDLASACHALYTLMEIFGVSNEPWWKKN